jgi:hypothetical protein
MGVGTALAADHPSPICQEITDGLVEIVTGGPVEHCPGFGGISANSWNFDRPDTLGVLFNAHIRAGHFDQSIQKIENAKWYSGRYVENRASWYLIRTHRSLDVGICHVAHI